MTYLVGQQLDAEKLQDYLPAPKLSTSSETACLESGLQAGDLVSFKLEINNTKTPLLRVSLNENRFMTLTVTPTSFKTNRLYLSRSFTRVNMMESAEGKKIAMLNKHGIEWPVNLVMDKKTKVMHFGSHLNKFLKANGLRSYESFVLVWEDTASSPMFCSKVKTLQTLTCFKVGDNY